MILITGATGFVGRAVVDSLLEAGAPVVATVRKHTDELPNEVEQILIEDFAVLSAGGLSASHELAQRALQGVDVVIHTVARVHMMQDDSSDPLVEFRRVNRDATLAFARLAAEAGVNRFVFLSSIKVNGEMTEPGQFFSPNDTFVPTDPYGLSKYEAEQGLLQLARETAMEVVIIRPPLVYGPGVKANFASMMRWINKGWPLPFGAVHNVRSLVALDNLVSFIIHCIDHPKAANEIFLISDREDVSTTELLRRVASAFGKKPHLLSVPVVLMEFVAKLVSKEAVANRLFGSLQVDSSKAQKLLGWKPVISMDEQLKKIAKLEKRH